MVKLLPEKGSDRRLEITWVSEQRIVPSLNVCPLWFRLSRWDSSTPRNCLDGARYNLRNIRLRGQNASLFLDFLWTRNRPVLLENPSQGCGVSAPLMSNSTL